MAEKNRFDDLMDSKDSMDLDLYQLLYSSILRVLYVYIYIYVNTYDYICVYIKIWVDI